MKFKIEYINKFGNKKEFVKDFKTKEEQENYSSKLIKNKNKRIKISKLRDLQKIEQDYNLLLNDILCKKRKINGNLYFIYALIKDDEIVYIGQSADIMGRLSTHISSSKVFDHYSIIETFSNISSDYVLKKEKEYIQIFRPKYNKTYV
jgi:hypothetical protein